MGATELTALLAFLSACTALSIDSVLPAFPQVRRAFGLAADSTAPAMILSAFFLGLAIGQLIWGSVADRYGRVPTLRIGFAIMAIGSLGAALAPSMAVMLPSRVIWGVGAASARGVSIAITRDLFEGRDLSAMMSRVQSIFMLAPIFAPSLGALILLVLPWRSVFATGALFAVMGIAWVSRLGETLREEHRRSLDPASLFDAFRQVLTTRATMWFAVALTLHYAAFFPYLGTSELIFGELYGHAAAFPLLFGAAGIGMGIAGAITSRAVDRMGTAWVSRRVMVAYVALSALFATVCMAGAGNPPFWLFYGCLVAVLVMHLPLSPIYNSEAMQPVGHLAGTAASVVGTLSLGVGTALGTPVANLVGPSVAPLALGFLIFGGVGVLAGVLGSRSAYSAETSNASM
jgi:DHA1 family bicyclomycin/chloramphenicol resistance-like MFS transporter